MIAATGMDICSGYMTTHLRGLQLNVHHGPDQRETNDYMKGHRKKVTSPNDDTCPDEQPPEHVAALKERWSIDPKSHLAELEARTNMMMAAAARGDWDAVLQHAEDHAKDLRAITDLIAFNQKRILQEAGRSSTAIDQDKNDQP